MRENETNQQHLLLMIEAAQRAGHSEETIVEIVEEAADTDTELQTAA